MPVFDANEALATAERALRQLLQHVLRDKYGAGWLEKVSSDDDRAGWDSKRTEELARRNKRGVADVPDGPLAYTQFWDLRKMAGQHWDVVAPALGKKAEFDPLLKRIEDLRNTLGHSREVLPFEADLVSGIAGDLRNRVTIFMSSKDPNGDYFPRIELVREQHGYAFEVTEPDVRRRQQVKTGLTLRIGDEVRFDCRGVDPQGRPLHWQLFSMQAGECDVATGDRVELVWKIDNPVEVAEKSWVEIRLKSDGPYHRMSVFDDTVQFQYQIFPPET